MGETARFLAMIGFAAITTVAFCRILQLLGQLFDDYHNR